jgi:hypothetical protein
MSNATVQIAQNLTADHPGRTLAPSCKMMPTIRSDADTADNASQAKWCYRAHHYAPGFGQSGVAEIADETVGEYDALGTQSPVGFKPYLDRLQTIFNNRYFLVFQARKKEGSKKSPFQRRWRTRISRRQITSGFSPVRNECISLHKREAANRGVASCGRRE